MIDEPLCRRLLLHPFKERDTRLNIGRLITENIFKRLNLQKRPVFTEAILDKGDHVSIIRAGKKLIRSEGPSGKVKWLYYDLDSDPLEENVLSPEEGGDEAQALKKILESFIKQRGVDFNKKGDKGLPSQKDLDALKEMGYI